MALRYVVKKRMIGFGKEKTEKYVAQNFITNTCLLYTSPSPRDTR